MGLLTGEPEAAPSPHRDLRDTPDPRPCPARAPTMTTTLVSATIFDLSEVLCKVNWNGALTFQRFSLFSFALKRKPPKVYVWESRGEREKVKIVFEFPPRSPLLPTLKEFGPLLPTIGVRTVPARGLHGNVTQRPELSGGKFVWWGSPRGARHRLGLGQLGAITCCSSPLSLVLVSRCVPRASPPSGVRVSLDALRPPGLGRGSLGEVSLRAFCWEILSCFERGWNPREKGQELSFGRMLQNCSGASVGPSSARLPLGMGGRAANFGG